jgi:hypothetical protein
MAGWLAQNWFDILSTIGIVGSLLFTAHSSRAETKTRRISNLITLTQNHREIWSALFKNPELERVVGTQSKEPITVQEEILVNLVIQHLQSVFYAVSDKLVLKPEQLRRDIRDFFSLPIPRAVWEKNKVFQNEEFVAFVESERLDKP